MQPYEIVAGPFTLWLAPTGTAFPLLGVAPAEDWVKVGTGGDRNYSEEGVTLTHNQSIAQARPGGTTGPVKAWRESEDLLVEMTLWDITLEQYRIAINGAAVTTTAPGSGTIGTKKMGLSRGREVTAYALLVRGVSPYGDTWPLQYEVPRCYESGNPAPQYRKGTPAGLALQFAALEDLAAANESERFGRLLAQHAAALPGA